MSTLFHDVRWTGPAAENEIWLMEGNTILAVPNNNLLSREDCVVVRRFDLLKRLGEARAIQGGPEGEEGKLTIRFKIGVSHNVVIEYNGDIMTKLLTEGFVMPLKRPQ